MKGTGSAEQVGDRKQSTCQEGVRHTKKGQRDVVGAFECQQVRVEKLGREIYGRAQSYLSDPPGH